MSTLVLVLASAVALVAVSIHVTMPTFGLMVIRLVAAELSAYLVALEIVAIVAAALILRDGLRVAAIAVAVVGIVLATIPLMRAPGVVHAADRALAGIGAPGTDDTALSPLRLFTGLDVPAVSPATDIVFRSVGSTTLKLDRYDGAGSGPHPALVVVHGGSWRNGDKGPGAIDPTIASRVFAGRGITVYDIQYRLAPGTTFPGQLEDVICALGHIRAHAAADGVDPERVAILGRSAGAHLALLAAYRVGRDAPPDGCGPPARVRGVISLYGPTDLATAYRVPADPDLIGGTAAIGSFMGGSPDALPQRYALASPQSALDRPVPPTLLIHGQADQIVKPFHSRSLADALRRAGDPVALVELPWAGHGFDGVSWGIGGQIALSAMLRFLALVL